MPRSCSRRWSCSVGSGGVALARRRNPRRRPGPPTWTASRRCRRSRRARCRSPSRRVRWCRALGASGPPRRRPRSCLSAARSLSARRSRSAALVRSASGSNGWPARPRRAPGRVLLEHLLDLLVQLERGQLQQADRLLQLRRQRQVLREAEAGRTCKAAQRFHPRGPDALTCGSARRDRPCARPGSRRSPRACLRPARRPR